MTIQATTMTYSFSNMQNASRNFVRIAYNFSELVWSSRGEKQFTQKDFLNYYVLMMVNLTWERAWNLL